ncbi:MAG TPA: GyrI-like domain-containing protein [Thermoanaerobaculia bacterium]|jgi:AraC family transcriptional regulator|nr:GyrI-like domain-containing protein [Thermoanaerobaculia bacterium]
MTIAVEIVAFPETKIAAVEHRGAPELEHETARRLIQWRIQNGYPPDRYKTYGIHYTDPAKTAPEEHRVDFAIAVDADVPPNPQGVINKRIPALRCAKARHLGSRENNTTARYLAEVWLPQSGERLADFPIFFHYVNVGPNVREEEMVTDVYLPVVGAVR